MTWVAIARRSSRDACAAIRDRASSSVQPRSAGHPLHLHLGRSVDDDHVRRTPRRARSRPAAGCRVRRPRRWAPPARARRSARRPGGARSPRAACAPARRRTPGGPSQDGPARRRRPSSSSPNSSTTASSPGVPFATTSRASASASMITAPELLEHGRDRALAGGDTACQSYSGRHGSIIPAGSVEQPQSSSGSRLRFSSLRCAGGTPHARPRAWPPGAPGAPDAAAQHAGPPDRIEEWTRAT